MMNLDKGFTFLGSIVVLAMVTTLVLPGRQTPGVIRNFFAGLAAAIRAAMGRAA